MDSKGKLSLFKILGAQNMTRSRDKYVVREAEDLLHIKPKFCRSDTSLHMIITINTKNAWGYTELLIVHLAYLTWIGPRDIYDFYTCTNKPYGCLPRPSKMQPWNSVQNVLEEVHIRPLTCPDMPPLNIKEAVVPEAHFHHTTLIPFIYLCSSTLTPNMPLHTHTASLDLNTDLVYWKNTCVFKILLLL